MRPGAACLGLWLAIRSVTALGAAGIQPVATIATIQVHGNVLTSEEDIVRLSGVAVGEPFVAGTVEAIATRLRDDGRFQQVEVLQRFASIADPSQIAVVIVVDEGPVKIERTGNADAPTRVVRSRGLGMLFLPVITYEEGHGLTYGVRLARPNPIGPRSQLSFPLTWGGDRRAGVQLETYLGHGAFRRVEVGGAVSRQVNPFYEESDRRDGVWLRGDARLPGPLRMDVSTGWQQVSFGGESDRVGRVGAGVSVDTRIDPFLARNAVYARAAWEHLDIASVGGLDTLELDVRGYAGLIGQAVLVARGARDDATGSRPDYLKPMIGGAETLRGFQAGTAVGDTLTSASLELRVPITSPLKVGKLGVSLFVDVATVYDEGERLRDQHFERGLGGGVWFSAAFVRFSLSVARGLGHSTRVNFATRVEF